MNYVDFGAGFSEDGTFRYSLWRRWGSGEACLWIGLNPSTADADNDDPTIRRCVGFSERWGYGAMVMVNLFAFRATRPVHLREAADPVGPSNDDHILAMAASAGRIVAAWGTNGALGGRDREVLKLLAGLPIWQLGETKDGLPKHPLYVRGDASPQRLYAEGER